MDSFYISLFLSILKTFIKNPSKAQKFKDKLLLIRDQITYLFPEDESE